MSTDYGGLRSRLVRDSLFEMVSDGLTALGWFDSGRQHLPLTFSSEPLYDETEVSFNTLTLADGNMDFDDAEMGSLLTELRWFFYMDFYGESDALALHLINDVASILRGINVEAGRSDSVFQVWDYSQATPPQIGYCDIEDVTVDRNREVGKPWKRHWFSVFFTVIDYVG
jgi:hypothetical protein